jgi:hypothetical protein
MQQDVED